jgi:DNA (cytosine-5)-methyltransferase 1
MPHPSPSNHAVFSFFSGAGFLDLGFEAAGFETVFANEINADFVGGYIHPREKIGISAVVF